MTRIVMVTLGICLLCSFGCNRPPESHTTSNDAVVEIPEHVVVDRLKREVRFRSSPKRIISLMPAATELMYAIGAGPQLVGVTKNCNYPPEAESLERVGGGTMESISREKIISLAPDLVLCKWDHHQPLMETLAQFDIPALAIGPETFEELFGEAKMLGDVTGHAAEAEQLIEQMRQRLAGINHRTSAIPMTQRRKVFYEVWDDPLMTAGPGSFIGEALRLAGMQNIFEDASGAYPKVSNEVVVDRNPDIIFSPSTHASRVSLEKMLQRQGWGEVTAIKEKQVFIVNGDHISRCGPRLLDAIEEMISLAYPNVGLPPLDVRAKSAGVPPLGGLPDFAGVPPLGGLPIRNSNDSNSYLIRQQITRERVPAAPEYEYECECESWRATNLRSRTLSLGEAFKEKNQLKPRRQRMTESVS